MNPTISVIIIALNEEKYLPLLLDDLVNQTDGTFEVIVVDGGSEDKTKEKALAFGDRLNLHFFESHRPHVSLQRNYGATKAVNEYLFFLDADSRIQPFTIERIRKYCNSGTHKVYIPTIAPSKETLFYRYLYKMVVAFIKLMQWMHKPLSLGGFMVIQRSAFDKVGGFSEQVTIAEDHNLIIRLYRAGYPAKILDDVPVIFSLRRFEKESKLHLFISYIKYTILTLLYDGVILKKDEYRMGGQHYDKNK